MGLRATHQAAHLGYAVLEGVSFGLLDGLSALRQAGGNAQQLQLVGGGARSALWAQLLADVLGLRIATYQVSSVGAALGAARLGQLAAEGCTAASIARVCTQHAVEHIYQPNAAAQKALAQRFAQFTLLYAALKPVFKVQAQGAAQAALG
jgi:xylulokinase